MVSRIMVLLVTAGLFWVGGEGEKPYKDSVKSIWGHLPTPVVAATA